MGYVVGEDGLAIQDADSLDASTLTPLTPEVISRQATINIGASLRNDPRPIETASRTHLEVLGLKSIGNSTAPPRVHR